MPQVNPKVSTPPKVVPNTIKVDAVKAQAKGKENSVVVPKQSTSAITITSPVSKSKMMAGGRKLT